MEGKQVYFNSFLKYYVTITSMIYLTVYVPKQLVLI